MAQKINIVLIDDIDGTDAEETVSFALDGKDYTIDLNVDNAQKLRDALAPYLGHATKATGRPGRRTASAAPKAAPGTSASEIRSWAREHGFEVPDRGRVSAEVREAYASAH